MRLTKTFKIEPYDKQFIVKELTVKEIITLLQDQMPKVDMTLESFKDIIADKFLPLACNIEMNDLIEMAPSEIETVFNHFMEVNKSFLAVAQKMGLGNLIENLKVALIADFGSLAVSLLNQAIEGSSNTDTPST